MEQDLKGTERVVWCHVFMSACVARAASTSDSHGAVSGAAAVADNALEVLRKRGLVGDAAGVLLDRVLHPSADSIPVCMHDY